eukprot:scaffold136906_cov124-Phaeocystis_antarctica.AAC.1
MRRMQTESPAIVRVTMDARTVLRVAKWDASASAQRMGTLTLPTRANAARALLSTCAILNPSTGPTPKRARRERIPTRAQ